MISKVKSGRGKYRRVFSWRRLTPRKVFNYLRYFNWLRLNPSEMPLYSNLDESLPLPELNNVKVLWPDRYSYVHGLSNLEVIRSSFLRLVPVVTYDTTAVHQDWRNEGGFPVPEDWSALIGQPCFPKSRYDIRGELFQIQIKGKDLNCAYDYSDYPVVSTDILNKVDLYFKCMASPGPLPHKVLRVGYFANQANMLAKARAYALKKPRERDIGVYGRFGSWTDSQEFRKHIVEMLKNSSLNFVGGLGEMKTYPAYLDELSRAKIAIEVPGQGPISYRLIEGMALGALIVCRKPKCDFPEELVDGKHFVSFKNDISDLIEVCRKMLEDIQLRQIIVSQAMSFFDRNFSPQSMVRRMLRAAFELVELK
jgi:glycosyltransferase involved in cell wall biosynthesis